MRLTEDIYLVGSAEFGLSNAYDCHVYLLDGGEEATLIDCGVGYDTGQIIRNIEKYILHTCMQIIAGVEGTCRS